MLKSLLGTWVSASVLLLLLLAGLGACGGKVIEIGPAEDAAGGDTGGDGGSCVNVDLTTYDKTCNQDSDCMLVTGGELCPGSCDCGGTPINVSGEARYSAATAGISFGGCPCASSGNVKCIQNQCELCGFGGNNPQGCETIDAAPPFDSGPPIDAATCVNVDVSTYDTSCAQDSDCIQITPGEICTGSCLCGGGTVNIDGQAQYDQTVNSIATTACPCVAEGVPRCVQATCRLCGGPKSSPGCPDGG